MVLSSFTDAALLLIGHGSTQHAHSGDPVYQHAAELRRRRTFARVAEAFWKQPPGIRSVLETLSEKRIFILPLFLSDGYFTEEVLPRELELRAEGESSFARVQSRGSQTIYYCSPIGAHPSLTQLVLGRARDVLEKHPFPRVSKPTEIALFLAGHGTERNENSRRALEEHAAQIRALQVYGEVHAVFLEEDPRVEHCCQLSPLQKFVVVPFFLSNGLHVAEDIPLRLGEPERAVRARLDQGKAAWRNPTERKGKLIWYAPSLGTDPQLTGLILERVNEAAGLTSPGH